MTLRVKLGLMLLVPLLALAVFATVVVQDKLSDRTVALEMRQHAELAYAVGELIHELQRERGLSGIAVNVSDTPAVDLAAQRGRTNETYVRFESAVRNFPTEGDRRFSAGQTAVEARWERLQEQRRSIDDGAVNSRAAMLPYTGLIEQLLDLATTATTVQSDGSTLSSLSVAHGDFLHAQERAAMIRGTLGAAATVGVLTEVDRRELDRLVIQEQTYLHSFLDRAPSQIVEMYWAVFVEEEVQTASQLRSALLTGDLISASPDGGEVFEGLSGQVDGLLNVERGIVREIEAEAAARETASAWALAIIGIGAAALLVLSFVVLAVAARSIARPLVALADGARKIAEGDLEAEPSEWTNDAIGEIGEAFDDMRAYLAEMAAAAEELAWGNLEIEVEPRSAVDTFGNSIAAMTRRLSLMMVESEYRAEELEQTVGRLRRSEEELWHAASHDALTGLPNRAHFMDRLERELGRARKTEAEVAVAFLDLDQFKAINDTHGHEAGDRLLQLVAQRVRARLRRDDTVARLGGDEFALVLADLRSEPAPGELIQRIVDSLSLPYEVGGKRFSCAASVGIALYPSDGEDAETLLAHADHAMYESKRRGGATYCFYTDDGSVADIAV